MPIIFQTFISHIFPVFAVMLLGIIFAKRGLFDGASAQAINRFVFFVALPALLFSLLADAAIDQVDLRLLGLYFLSEMVLLLTGSFVARKVFRRSWSEALLLGMAACFVNHAFFVLPIAQLIYGEEARIPITVIIAVDTTVIFAGAIIGLEVAANRGEQWWKVPRLFISNPVLVSIFIGLLVNFFNINVHQGLINFAEIAGQAATPAALFSLGIILAGADAMKWDSGALTIAGLKTFLHPIVAWLLFSSISTNILWHNSAMLVAAGLCGAMPFVLALQYNVREDTIGKAEYSLQSFDQIEVSQFVAAGEKERTQSSRIIVTSLLKRQKYIATHCNGDMADHAVKIPQLSFPLKIQIVFHHLEEYFDIPSFTVNPDNFFIRQVNLGGQNRQPFAFLMVANKNNFNLLPLFGFRNHAGKNPCLAGSLFQLAEQSAKRPPLPLVAIKHFGHILGHTYHGKMLAKGGKQGWKTKPVVHKDIVSAYPSCQNPFDHGFQVIRGFGDSLQSSLVTAGTFIQLLGNTLNSFVLPGRRTQYKIQWQETHSVGPAKSQQFETFQASAAVMVMDPGQQLHYFGARSVIGVVVENQNLLALLICQYIEKTNNQFNQAQHELPLVVPWVLKEVIGRILLEIQCRVANNPLSKIHALKRQHENNREQLQRPNSTEFTDTAVVKQSTDLKIADKGSNPIMQPFCFLLLVVLIGTIHLSLSLLILLTFSSKSMYQKVKGFSP